MSQSTPSKKELFDLRIGDSFQLKKDGKYYTVHCHVCSLPDDQHFDRMNYTLATDGSRLSVFDSNRIIFVAEP